MRRSARRYLDLRGDDGPVPDLAASALTENYRRLAKALQRGTTTQFITVYDNGSLYCTSGIPCTLENELDDKHKRKTFELYRNQLSDVTVVTYDELVRKTQNLIKVLECAQ